MKTKNLTILEKKITEAIDEIHNVKGDPEAYIGEQTIELMAKSASLVYDNGAEIEEYFKDQGEL